MNKFFTIQETARMLKIHPTSVRRLIARKKLSCIRVGGLIRIGESQLKKMLKNGIRK